MIAPSTSLVNSSIAYDEGAPLTIIATLHSAMLPASNRMRRTRSVSAPIGTVVAAPASAGNATSSPSRVKFGVQGVLQRSRGGADRGVVRAGEREHRRDQDDHARAPGRDGRGHSFLDHPARCANQPRQAQIAAAGSRHHCGSGRVR